MKTKDLLVAAWLRSLGLLLISFLTVAPLSAADSGDVTDDIQPFFMCSANPTCPGEAMAVWADMDGVDNGSVYDPYETMVTFYTATGYACGENTSGIKTYFHTPHDTACVAAPGDSCTVDGSCDRGRFVIHFVDMTTAGFDQRDPSTWAFKTVPRVSFELSNDGTPRAGVATPYQQAKAYKVMSGIIGDPTATPDPANLIDIDPTCDAAPSAVTNCEFADPDDGIAEIWVRTDYVESNIDQLVLHSPASPGVALLMDGSGSMSWRHDGERPVPVEQQRITLAKQAAIEFMDQLLDHGDGLADFGVARFPRHPYDGCNAETVVPMTLVNTLSHDAAVAPDGAIQSLETGGATPMLAGLQQAAGMLGTYDPKVIVLLSDGYHNCPSTIEVGDAAYSDLISSLAGIRVFTIGFARPGDLGGHFLDELAADTVGTELGVEGFYDVTGDSGFNPENPEAWDPATALTATYTKILAAGLGLDMVADPFGSVSAGETKSHPLVINGQDHKISFHLSWTTPQTDRLSIHLKASDGSSVESETAGVRIHAGPTYRIITVDEAFLAQPGKVTAEPWRLEVEGAGVPAEENERYQYSVIVDSAVKMRAWLDKKRPRTGDVITLTARATEASTALTTLDAVEVKLTRPSNGLGNWFATHKISPAALDKVPPNISGENLPPIQRKAMYLTEVDQVALPGREAVVTLPMYDDGTHGDVSANDGLYTTQYSETVREGTYSFLFHIRGNSIDGGPFERQRFIQKHVSVAPAADHLGLSVLALGETADKVQRFAVTVTPRDALGNYFGPTRSADITLSASKGQFSDAVMDNLDGSYTQTLTLPVNVDLGTVDIVAAIEDSSRSFSLGEYVAKPPLSNWLLILILILIVAVILILWLRR